MLTHYKNKIFKKLRIIVPLIAAMSIISGCFSKNDSLESSLRFAQSNRKELEKVLLYYQNDPLKLAASKFLIENMPYKYSYKDSIAWKLLEPLLFDAIQDKFYRYPEKQQKLNRISFLTSNKIYDSHIITAEYLIEQIDLAFEVWEKYPWNKELPFDDFCELILPYRIGNEPLSRWRKKYFDKYVPILDSLYQGTDVVKACEILYAVLSKEKFYYVSGFNYPHFGGVYLFDNRVGTCREMCDLAAYTMRACGIPVSIDFYHASPEYQHSHVWSVVRDTTGIFYPFNVPDIKPQRSAVGDRRKRGKVYRNYFGMQQELYKGIAKDESVPGLFKNRFIKDVTSNYTGKNSIEISVKQEKEKYIYLGVFNPKGWVPIGITESRKDRAIFTNVEKDIIYQALYSDGLYHRPTGYPFIYTSDSVHVLKPDTIQTTTAVLTRKMPLWHVFINAMYENMIGARFEGSNSATFDTVELLHQISDTLIYDYNEIEPLITSPFRYVRYVSPPDKFIELSEAAFYNDTVCLKKIPAQIINEEEPVWAMEMVIDDNPLSCYKSKYRDRYVAFDFGKPEKIKKIVFYPRNDDNFICPNQEYELLYYGVNGWTSLGRKIAESRKLYYNIPSNALLRLRNLSKGKQEQIFIYRNGRQYFTKDL